MPVKSFPFELKIYHDDGETCLKPGTDLAKWIDSFTKMWIEKNGIPEEGVFQYVKKSDGAALHWLSPVDLNWEYILGIKPAYSSDKKIQEIHSIFKCI